MSNSDSEEEFIGPVIPGNLQQKPEERREQSDDSSSEEEFGVALPPGFQMNPSSSSQKESSKDSSKPRNIGPTLPSGFSIPSHDSDEDSSEDEILGPMPEQEFDPKHNYDGEDRLNANRKDEKREKWMLEPPKALTKSLAQPQKNAKSVTQFSQKSSKTPQLLTEEMKQEIAANAKKDEKIREYMDKYKESDSKRSMSLMEQHHENMKQSKKLKRESDKNKESYERKAFDPTKDLVVRNMDSKKKNAFVSNATSDFGTRFSSGRFQKFL